MRLFYVFCLLLLLPACASTPTATAVAVQTATGSILPATATAVPATVSVTNTPAETPQATQPAPGSEELFVVIKPDGSKVSFTAADLQKLPLANVSIQGKANEGPTLKDVLTAAGITDFQKVYLTGKNGKLRLPRNQVDGNTLLVFTERGTVKLVTTYIPKQNWTQDVAWIEVN
jgi:hypothetical protein